MSNKNDLNKIKTSITPEKMIKIMRFLGANRYEERENFIIFPTICHNYDADEASMKLYYYKEDYLFYCYTECAHSFSIYDLFKAYYELHRIQYNFTEDILNKILELSNLARVEAMEDSGYNPQRSKYDVKEEIELLTYEDDVLAVYLPIAPLEWLAEGISKRSMDKYHIKFSISQNKIVIPHYNIKGQLVGIRGRTLTPWEANNYGKYMPMKIEGRSYAHPLSLNLYGIDLAKDYIKETKRCIIFEGEKSVLLYDTYFPKNNSVAVCGSGLNKHQLDILVKQCGAQEIVIAFDKEFTSLSDPANEEYMNKLLSLCNKYKTYCNFSFLYDFNNLLSYKDSPIDKGPEVFLQLLQKKVEV